MSRLILGFMLGLTAAACIELADAAHAQAERVEPRFITRVESWQDGDAWIALYHVGGGCVAVWQYARTLTSQPVPCPWDKQ